MFGMKFLFFWNHLEGINSKYPSLKVYPLTGERHFGLAVIFVVEKKKLEKNFVVFLFL